MNVQAIAGEALSLLGRTGMKIAEKAMKYPVPSWLIVSILVFGWCFNNDMGIWTVLAFLSACAAATALSGTWATVGSGLLVLVKKLVELLFFGHGFGVSMLTWSGTLFVYATFQYFAGAMPEGVAWPYAASIILLCFGVPVLMKEKAEKNK